MHLIRKIFLTFLCFLFLTISSFAISDGETQVLTLKDCIEKALNNSPIVKKQKLNYEMAKKDVKLAQSVYFPTLSGGVSYNFSDRESNVSSTSNNLGVSASIKQLIWDFGKTHADVKREKFYRIAAYYDFDTTVLDTILDTKVKYFTALAAKVAIEVDKTNLQINERNYQRTNAYFNEGLKSKIDLVNSEVYVTQAKVALIASENLYKNSLSELNNAMYLAYHPEYHLEIPSEFSKVKDITPESLTELDRPIEDFLAPPEDISDAVLTAKVDTTNYASLYKFDKFPYSFEECLEIANKNRPDIKAYNSLLDAAKQQLLSVKRSIYPQLSFTGSYNYDGSNVNSITNDTNSFGIGVNLSTSINAMNQKYKIDSQKLQVELVENDIDLLKQNIYFEVQQAYIDMIEFQEQIPLLEQKIQQTLENLELADGRYIVGLGDYIELQNARMNYNTAQHSFIQAVFKYNVAKAKLEKVIALDQKVTVRLEDKYNEIK